MPYRRKFGNVTQIVFNLPTRQTPGYFLRQRKLLEIEQDRKKDPTPETIDKLVNFLADYVQAESPEKARALMWQASEEQWDQMLDAIGGASKEVPPTNAAP